MLPGGNKMCGSVNLVVLYGFITQNKAVHIYTYIYIGSIFTSLSLSLLQSFITLGLFVNRGGIQSLARAYDPHIKGYGHSAAGFTWFNVVTSFTIVSRQSCLQERNEANQNKKKRG